MVFCEDVKVIAWPILLGIICKLYRWIVMVVDWTRCGHYIIIAQVGFWVELPEQRRLCPNFVKILMIDG